LRNAENIYDRKLEIVGTNFPIVGHNLQFKRLDTGDETIHLGMEVNWESDTLTSVDIATIKEHLWSDSKLNVAVRFTDGLYEPVSAWSSAFILAADATACGAVRPTPTATPTVSGSSVTGIVFEDGNSNGMQDGGEPGVKDATVTLWDGVARGWRATREIRTDAAGVYEFAGVAAGSYQLGVELPERYGVPGMQWQDVNVNSGNVSVPPVAAPRIHWHLYIPTINK